MLTTHATNGAKEILHNMLQNNDDVSKVVDFIDRYKQFFVVFIHRNMPYSDQLSGKHFSMLVVDYMAPQLELLNNKVLYEDIRRDNINGVWIPRDGYFTSMMALEHIGSYYGFNKNRCSVAQVLSDEGASYEGTLYAKSTLLVRTPVYLFYAIYGQVELG